MNFSRKCKIVFFGTPPFAASLLQSLFKSEQRSGIEIVAVVTQPDRARGRDQKITPSAVKLEALKHLPLERILQPQKASEQPFLQELIRLKADLFVVVAYGQILSRSLLDIPPLGVINVHTSLLPKYRGAAPIHRALMAGDAKTGVTIMQIVEKLDAGPIYKQVEVDIGEQMNFAMLEALLLQNSFPALVEVILDLFAGRAQTRAQDSSKATYAAKILPEDSEIDFSKPAKEIHNLIRALAPRPGAFFMLLVNGEKRRVKVLSSLVVEGKGRPGELMIATSDRWVVACGEQALELLELQTEGKKAMSLLEWSRGIRGIVKIELKSSSNQGAS